MFFKKAKNEAIENIEEVIEEISDIDDTAESDTYVESEEELNEKKEDFPYSFYKPEPYPRELVSVITKMIKKSFPDTKKAFLLEAQQNNKKGYLVIVDAEPKYLKILNLYITGETKRLIGDTPIECVLYSKSGTITEGIDPFYRKETASSKANNLASNEFSGDIEFSQMPEFELWKNSDDKDDEKTELFRRVLDENEDNGEAVDDEQARRAAIDKIISPAAEKKVVPKVKPTSKEELFAILNEYASKKSGEVSGIAMAAIREYEFYIPYTSENTAGAELISETLPIDDSLKFKRLINEEGEIAAVPLFTQEEEALEFAKRDACLLAHIKYKDFVSTDAADNMEYSGILINPDEEAIYLACDNPLLR